MFNYVCVINMYDVEVFNIVWSFDSMMFLSCSMDG